MPNFTAARFSARSENTALRPVALIGLLALPAHVFLRRDPLLPSRIRSRHTTAPSGRHS